MNVELAREGKQYLAYVQCFEQDCCAMLSYISGIVQDYIDSMEGATLSGRQCAGEVVKSAAVLAATAT